MELKNYVLFIVLVSVFSIPGIMDYASALTDEELFKIACVDKGLEIWEITNHQGKTAKVCKMLDWNNDWFYNSWLNSNDGFLYLLKNDEYYWRETIETPCDDGKPNCYTLSWKEHLIPQAKKEAKPVTPQIDNSIRSWINLTKAEPEPIKEEQKSIILPTENLKIEDKEICNTLVANKSIPSTVKYFGMTTACLHQEKIDGKWVDSWIGNDGKKYFETTGGGFEVEPITKLDYKCDDNGDTVMTRINCHYTNHIKYETERAKLIFNATIIQKSLTPSFEHEIKDRYTDCNGKSVSAKQNDCTIQVMLKLEAEKATQLWNGTEIIKQIEPSKTIEYPEERQREKFLRVNNLLWMIGDYTNTGHDE